jgi:hypothetical protein
MLFEFTVRHHGWKLLHEFLVDATTALGDIYIQTKKLILMLSSSTHNAFKKDKYLLFEVNLRSIVLHTGI